MNPRFQPTSEVLTPYLFFTGKGGVGKTSTACATALALANEGKNVLIVSTDPASNLQDVFEQPIGYDETIIKDAPRVTAINLDPEAAASAYREKVVGPFRDKLPAAVVAQMEEQMSGACTVEIAAFDEFATILTNQDRTEKFDHIIFDTAPTGHTLRLLQLPSAWSGFLEESTHGASCLGPLSGLAEKKELYDKAVHALSNRQLTTLILVTRPDESALKEAARASNELREIGLENQQLIMNGKLQSYIEDDSTSVAFYNRQQQALQTIPSELKQLTTYELPFVPYQLTGVQSLSSLFDEKALQVDETVVAQNVPIHMEKMKDLIETVGSKKSGVILTMGKGGVGKTTMASVIAIGLAEMGHTVHLTTTDPAEHLTYLFNQTNVKKHLTISRIDPKVEVENYKNEVLNQASDHLDENGLAYLEEDLNSPCTEEIAVFRAFANVVEEANEGFVVIDTAPTGHTLLLLDAAESYHKELERSTGDIPASVSNLLPRLRNADETDVFIVTLPEATPVYEAERLQEDLQRAGIKPSAWIINQSFAATDTTDPVLKARAQGENRWLQLVQSELAQHTILIPWQRQFTVGYQQLKSFI